MGEGMAQHRADSKSGLCIGKEWYRFPSSFFLPEDAEGKALPLLWLNSSFDGQLPRPFGPWPLGLSQLTPEVFNDQNLREEERYSAESDCSFLVDLMLEGQ